jgi:outer membrane protein OmpA-like peptidoglycan-associated protein
MKLAILLLFSFCSSIRIVAQEIKDTLSIHFPFDQSVLTPAARSKLDSFLIIYKSINSPTPLTIKGHCDSLGTPGYNENLSKKRSFAVHNYLLRNGLPKEAIEMVEGYGESMPLNTNSTPEEQQQNRRVELVWTQKTEPPVTSETPKDTVIEFSKEVVDTVKEGQTLRLRNINFYGGSHRFLPESQSALNELLEVMKSYPTVEIEIQGHICCLHGTPGDGVDFDSGNRMLSVNRARAVYEFLIENGIDPKRMTYKGFAATKPLVFPENSEEDRTMNRRVEIQITKR